MAETHIDCTKSADVPHAGALGVFGPFPDLSLLLVEVGSRARSEVNGVALIKMQQDREQTLGYHLDGHLLLDLCKRPLLRGLDIRNTSYMVIGI